MSTFTDFNQLAAFVVDNESNLLEKTLNSISREDLRKLKNVFGQSLMFCAVAADKLKHAEILVKRGLDWNDVDTDGITLLHWAVKFTSFSCIKHLISSGDLKQKLFAKDKYGVSPLHIAAQNKRAKVLKILLDASREYADQFNEVCDMHNRSPLHYAAEAGSLEACAILLEDDLFYIDMKDELKQTPLMFAIGCKYSCDVVRFLGKKKPMSITARNKLGLTPFHLAVMANNTEVLHVLLTEFFDVKPTIFDNNDRTPLHVAAALGRVEATKMLVQNGFTNESVDAFGATPAHYAAKKCVKTLEVILSAVKEQRLQELREGQEDGKDADLFQDMEDKKKRTCLMWAVLAENEPVVLWLLSNQSLFIDRRARDEYLCTALHLAAQVGSLSIAKILIKQGWSLTDRDMNDATPSHIAAGRGHTELIRHFQTALASTEERDGADRTPLFYACAGGQSSTVKIMVNDLNFAVRVGDQNGQTPLHYAALSGTAACVRALLEKDPDLVDIADKNGRTALHIACLKGKRDLVKTLLDADANVNAESAQHDTPSSIASARGHSQIMNLLNLYGAKDQPR